MRMPQRYVIHRRVVRFTSVVICYCSDFKTCWHPSHLQLHQEQIAELAPEQRLFINRVTSFRTPFPITLLIHRCTGAVGPQHIPNRPWRHWQVRAPISASSSTSRFKASVSRHFATADSSVAPAGRTLSNFWSRFSARHASSNSRLIAYAIPHDCRLQEKGPAAVAVTSPTGLSHSLSRRPLSSTTSFAGASAVSIDGVTLHSFAGCGVPSTADFGKMFGKENVAKWLQLQVLIVDEISMVQVCAALGDDFPALIGTSIRRNSSIGLT
jgi:hypothetical protein